MNNSQTLKTVSFILSLVLLLIALTMVVCLFVLPDALRDPYKDSDGNTSDGSDDGSGEGSGGKELGFAFAIILLIPLLLAYLILNALYGIAPLVLSIRQRFNGKNRAIPMLVLDLIRVVCLFVATIACITATNSILHPLFHVLIIGSFLAVTASTIVDIALLAQNKRHAENN